MSDERRRWRPPWQLEFRELTKYDWLSGVHVSQSHRKQVLVRDHAKALMDLADQKTNLIWASSKTIQQQALCHYSTKTSAALSELRQSGAITQFRIARMTDSEWAKIPEEIAAEIRKRDRRGVFYQLNLKWAYEAILAHENARGSEPDQLSSGRRKAGRKRQLQTRKITTPVNNPEVHYASKLSGSRPTGVTKAEFDYPSNLNFHCDSNEMGAYASQPNTKGNQGETVSTGYQEEPLRRSKDDAYRLMNDFLYAQEGNHPEAVFEDAVIRSSEELHAAFQAQKPDLEIRLIWNKAIAPASSRREG